MVELFWFVVGSAVGGMLAHFCGPERKVYKCYKCNQNEYPLQYSDYSGEHFCRDRGGCIARQNGVV